MNFNEYQDFAETTAIYPENMALPYTALGLAGEAGEYAEKIKKSIRDGVFNEHAAAKELGDVLWYMANAARHLGFRLEDIAHMNVQKLKDRQDRNMLSGSGDSR